MFTRLLNSPVTKGFFGCLLAICFAGLVFRMYQTDQLVRAVVTYINNANAQQRPQAPTPSPPLTK